MRLSKVSAIQSLSINLTMLRLIITTILGGIVGVLIHYYLLNSADYNTEDMKPLGFAGASIIWFVLIYLTYQSTKLLQRILGTSDAIGPRLLTGMIINGILAFSLNAIFYTYAESISVKMGEGLTWIGGDFSKIGVVSTIITIVCVVITFAIYTFQSYSEDQISFVENQRKQIDLRIMALKSQLSPHFLFNGLNTISSLIYTDKVKAESYIRDLYAIYNYALTKYNDDTVSLADELRLVGSYLSMVNIRYGDCITLSNDIDRAHYQTKVLPFSIQTLIENALKHNIAETKNPLNIRLSYKNNKISITNNKQLKKVTPTSTGVGHDNLQKRYNLLGSKGFKVDEDKHRYSVTIPTLS